MAGRYRIEDKLVNTKENMFTKKNGFSFVDVIFSVAILMICALAISSAINSYINNFNLLKLNDQINTALQDELLLLKTTQSVNNKERDGLNIYYEYSKQLEYKDKNLDLYILHIEGKEGTIHKEYNISIVNN